MEAITGPVMKLMLQEVMLMMFDQHPEQKFYPQMYILQPTTPLILNGQLNSWIACAAASSAWPL